MSVATRLRIAELRFRPDLPAANKPAARTSVHRYTLPSVLSLAGFVGQTHRTFQTSAVRDLGRPRTRDVISTLNPKQLSVSDFVQLSNRLTWAGRVLHKTEMEPPSIFGVAYRGIQNPTTIYIPFPEGTQGFFYYLPSDPSQPLGGQLRFRVTVDANPASFHTGYDLLHDIQRLPWSIPVVSILRSNPKVAHPGYQGLASLLLRDGTVDEDLIQVSRRVGTLNKASNLYLKLGQPFYLDFRCQHALYLTSADQLQRLLIGFCQQPRGRSRVYPFKGSAHVCLERHTTPSGKLGVALRVLRIIEPVEETVEHESHSLQRPIEGELLRLKSGKPLVRLLNQKRGSPGAALLGL